MSTLAIVGIDVILLIVLLMLSVPLPYCFGGALMFMALAGNVSMKSMMLWGYSQSIGTVLLASPLFIIAGTFMGGSGVAKRLLDLCDAFIGRIKGGLGIVSIVTCAIIGAISGSGFTGVAATGPIMIPRMEEQGYPRGFATALVTVSSVLGLLIPPSAIMIIYGWITETSILACFLSTVGPGILVTILFSIINLVECRKFDLTLLPPMTMKEKIEMTGKRTWSAIPAIMMPIMMFLMNGTTLMILWFGSKQVDAGIIQVGSIMAFMQYAMQVIMAFLMITMVAIMLPRANVSALRIHEVLSSDITVKDKENTKDFSSNMRGVVSFKNVSFRYPGADEDVLSHISFETKPGETTAFIGSTGSGKSTLINLVPRFYDVTSGSICVDGVDIRDVKQADLRSRIGYVPQKGMLLSGDIESNLLYSKKDANAKDIESALAISQSTEFVSKKPQGIHSEISQGGTNVSGGQRQRLSIARAIVRKPEIYIFDDSFSALDFKTDAKLREALAKSCKETKSTVLLVAQRISSILHADQIIVLEEGKMVGKGTHAELMESCDVYQQIASSQLTKEELANV